MAMGGGSIISVMGEGVSWLWEVGVSWKRVCHEGGCVVGEVGHVT